MIVVSLLTRLLIRRLVLPHMRSPKLEPVPVLWKARRKGEQEIFGAFLESQEQKFLGGMLEIRHQLW